MASPQAAPDARYEQGVEIGRGGMGRVVEATDTVLGRVVAVKEVLATDEEALRRFARETKITARLEHPSIVPVYDAGVTATGTPYYVMRKVSGRRLEDLVGEADTLQQRLALVPRLIAAIQAIAHAHARGIVHRDLKPANILFGDHGETVVIDWGLARAIDEPLDEPVEAHPIDAKDSLRTRIGTVFGTPGFMSAEQLCGEPVDARSDVYALGATMYFLLSRKVPHFGGNNDAIMKAAASGPPVPIGELVPDLPPELSTIVDKALAYRHADRYPDATALGEDLQRFLTGRLVASHRYTRRERLARFVRRHRVAVAAVTIALIALVVGGTVAMRSVLVERDRADDQARLATERQHDAEAAGARASERADQLLLAQAELILPTDPTAAIAMLKQLAAKPASWEKLWRQARAIAADARVEGVAWGLPGPTSPRSLEISPGGTRAIVVGDDDSLRLYELAARTHRPITTALRRIGATFADDGHVVIYGERAFEIIDLATETRRSVTVPERIEHLRASGDWLAWSTDPTRALWNLVDGAPQRLTTEAVDHFEFAPDGSRLLVAGKSALAIYTRHVPTATNVGPGGASWVAWDSASQTIAATYRGQVLRRRVDAPASEMFQIDDPSGRPIVMPGFITVVGSAGLHSLPASRFAPAFHDTLDIGAGLHAAPNGRLVAVTGNRLVVIEGEVSSEIRMPVVGHVRIAANPRSRFTIVASAGHLLIYDLDALYPRPRELTDDVAAFARVGPGDFLLVTQGMRWAWLDASGRRTPISAMLPALAGIGVSRSTDRVLVMDPTIRTGWILRKPDRIQRLTGNVAYGILRDDDTAFVATIEGDVAMIAPDFTRTVVISHRGEPIGTTFAGKWLATAYADNTIVRRDLSAPPGSENVLHLATPPRPGTMRQTADGRVFIPIDNTIQCWQLDGSLRAHVTLPGPISEVVGMDRYQLVRTEDKAGYVVDLEIPGRVSGAIPTGAISRSVSAAERLAVVEIPGAAPTLVDLESGHHWRLSRRRPGFQLIYAAISDDGQTVAALDTSKLLLWNLDLPHDAASTATWLDKLTNASAELGPTTMTWH